MKIYKVIFEDYRDTSNIVQEEQYVLAECIGHVWDEMGEEGVGYDKEMMHVIEIAGAVRILPKYEKKTDYC